MRKITEQASKAFWNKERYTSGNTKVIKWPIDTMQMFLHGNQIAQWHIRANTLDMTMCGWGTVTTRERLDGILRIGMDTFPMLRKLDNTFTQKQFCQYFNGKVISSKAVILFDLITGKYYI